MAAVRKDPVGHIYLTPGVIAVQGVGYLVAVVLGVVLTLLLHTPRDGRAPDAGVVASLAAGEEARRKKPPKKPKEPSPDPPPDDPPKKPKTPTVSETMQQMAGQPDSELCELGDTREQGCGPP